MMLTKIYLYTSLVIAGAFAAVLVSGNLTPLAIVVFGFVAFGMVFTGMMCVLPVDIAHPADKTLPKKREDPREAIVSTAVRHGVRTAQV
jgi:hypothetical protein